MVKTRLSRPPIWCSFNNDSYLLHRTDFLKRQPVQLFRLPFILRHTHVLSVIPTAHLVITTCVCSIEHLWFMKKKKLGSLLNGIFLVLIWLHNIKARRRWRLCVHLTVRVSCADYKMPFPSVLISIDIFCLNLVKHLMASRLLNVYTKKTTVYCLRDVYGCGGGGGICIILFYINIMYRINIITVTVLWRKFHSNYACT